jgi:hypothetical protein
MLSEPEQIPRKDYDDEYERELAEQELVKVITKLEKKITDKQNLFIGAMCTLILKCNTFNINGTSKSARSEKGSE